MRKYIRHPADIPIETKVKLVSKSITENLRNVSLGGLAFYGEDPYETGQMISIRIPLVQPAFEASAQVVWCYPNEAKYEIGVKLLDQDDAYHARMVEQVCHIEHYKREIYRKEGRVLNGQEAAIEWIEKFGNTFPVIHDVEIL